VSDLEEEISFRSMLRPNSEVIRSSPSRPGGPVAEEIYRQTEILADRYRFNKICVAYGTANLCRPTTDDAHR